MASRFFDTRFGRRLLIENIGQRVVSMTVDAGDHLMTFSPSDYIGRKVFRKGHFERENVDRLLAVLRERGLLRKEGVLLELGGNIGTQTVYFALSDTYSRIVSVEPDPRNFPLLEMNIRQNRLEKKVTLVNCAAGETAGEIDFFLNANNHGKSSAIRQSPSDAKISVPVKPVADILGGAGLDQSDVGLVWMDIEGYEPVACRSMVAADDAARAALHGIHARLLRARTDARVHRYAFRLLRGLHRLLRRRRTGDEGSRPAARQRPI